MEQMYKLSKRSRKEMVGLHPYIAFAVEKAILITDQDFGVLSGVRTNAQQSRLYDQGRTTEGSKVTWTMDSYHQYGLAVDLVAYVDGKYTWELKYYTAIVKAMKEVIADYNLPIEHGFDMWEKDWPHWQLTGFKPTYDIRDYT